jgi:hypothetical protein
VLKICVTNSEFEDILSVFSKTNIETTEKENGVLASDSNGSKIFFCTEEINGRSVQL